MFSDIHEAIKYIESKRSKHTVEQYKEIVEQLKIPVLQKNMIHVCGTNGKGSTVNYMRAILQAHGYKVATFTSPYLERHNDRIRINNESISDDILLNYINKYASVIEKEQLSMFEIDLMIALDYFNQSDIDYRIIECGIGGKRDKTNIIQPVAEVITNIGLDHQALLGESLEAIATDKSGVIKKNTLFYTTEKRGTLLSLFQNVCDQQEVMMHVVPEYLVNDYPFKFTFKEMTFVLHDQGVYQVDNARLALFLLDQLITLNPQKTIRAVETAIWQGRFEVLTFHKRKAYIDGAHNVAGIEQLVRTLKLCHIENAVIIFSALKDKNFDQMISILRNEGYVIYLTTFNDERAIDISSYKKEKDIRILNSYKDALRLAEINKKDIVVTGSLHFISDIRQYLLNER